MPDGLYHKYDVSRKSDTNGKHKDCWYFVLDPAHDEHAVNALVTYAKSCRDKYPQLSFDILANVRQITGKDFSDA